MRKKRSGLVRVRMLVLLQLVVLSTYANAFELITSNGVNKLSEYSSLMVILDPSTKKNSKLSPKIINKKRGCNSNNKYQALIDSASAQYGVNKELIKAVISVESCFNSGAISRKGAKGLMQLMPATAKRFGAVDVFNPSENINAGVRYLQFLLSRYKKKPRLAIAAYNAGEGAVDKYNAIPPYKETQAYVKKVLTILGEGRVDFKCSSHFFSYINKPNGMKKQCIL